MSSLTSYMCTLLLRARAHTQNVTSIAAHDGLLAALAFNSNATLLATASEKGTVIRVFSIPQGDRLMEFRRGLTRCVSICCLSFSLNNQFLVAASHTETVHVFKLESRSPNKNTDNAHSYGRRRTISTSSSASQGGGSIGGLGVDDTETNQFDESSGQAVSNTSGNNPILPDHRGSPLLSGPDPGQYQIAGGGGGGWGTGLMGWMGSTLKAYSSYLPHQVSEIFAQDRAFAYARLPAAPLNSLWAAATGRGSPVISSGTTAAADLTAAPAAGQSGGMHKVAAVVYYQNQPRLIVAGLDGLVHTFAIDPVNGGEANLLRSQRLLSPNPSSSVPRPIGQGHHGSVTQQQMSSDHSGQAASIREPVGAHLTGGPQHPGVYVAPRNITTGVTARATTFAGVVTGGTPLESDAKTPVSHPPEES
ncbi:WD repeat domain phosphoinositide-interacting protein 2 [Paragonimus westermani]|uniref:WD repeat domain phosphoinositide-interacting protein 2 n=1 Tax=Paragonimus westermani TaxID=34504 RepID=A0A8T0D2N1_9TREM|nr:WD repeat domain phosphoinositide-interacting protein 2 [Paragonimus westermani]